MTGNGHDNAVTLITITPSPRTVVVTGASPEGAERLARLAGEILFGEAPHAVDIAPDRRRPR